MFVLFKNQSSLLTFQRKFWNLTLNQLYFRMVPAALVFWILQTTKGSSINSKMKENFGKMAETCACAIWVAIPWFPVLPTIFEFWKTMEKNYFKGQTFDDKEFWVHISTFGEEINKVGNTDVFRPWSHTTIPSFEPWKQFLKKMKITLDFTSVSCFHFLFVGKQIYKIFGKSNWTKNLLDKLL